MGAAGGGVEVKKLLAMVLFLAARGFTRAATWCMATAMVLVGPFPGSAARPHGGCLDHGLLFETKKEYEAHLREHHAK
jgi:hypothetical protein